MTETTQPDPQVEPDDDPRRDALRCIECELRADDTPGGAFLATMHHDATGHRVDRVSPLDREPLAGPDPGTAQPADTRVGLNATHLPLLARLSGGARQAGVTITYCCLNNGWAIMTSPELDDAAGTAFLTALDVGEVGEPEQKTSRTILAGPEFSAGAVRLYVRPLPTDDTTEEGA